MGKRSFADGVHFVPHDTSCGPVDASCLKGPERGRSCGHARFFVDGRAEVCVDLCGRRCR